jgi:peptide/nickel transport system substrate-binding protein
MVFDTLYGLDESFSPHPQMAEGHTVDDGVNWTIRLREGLRFHDGTPVLARDVIASIRRFAARDGFGEALIGVTAELSALDDRTLRFRLTQPFPHLPEALAGSSTILPCIMPERLAMTDPFTAVTEMVGSGPYRFEPAEFSAGARACYERFSGYVPCTGGVQSYTAGPKIAHFDRIESTYLGDAATSVAALLRGEVDWLDRPPYDQLPLLARDPKVKGR